MRRTASILLAFAVLAFAGTRDARAQVITYTSSNAAFGPANSLTGFANITPVGLNVGSGVLLTSTGPLSPNGLLAQSDGVTATFSNLGGGSGVTAIGFTWGLISAGTLGSATFSNGGSYTTATSTAGDTFTGFTSTTPFTSVTLTFSGSVTSAVRAFHLPALAAVPEPSSLLSGGVMLLAACGAAVLRRKKATAAAV